MCDSSRVWSKVYERPRPSEHRRIIDDSSRKEGWLFLKFVHARDGFDCFVCNRNIIVDSSTLLVPKTSKIEIATRGIYEMKPVATDFILLYVNIRHWKHELNDSSKAVITSVRTA